jgi:hypothetical protein
MNHLSKWKISSYLAAIFLAGLVAGSFVGFKCGQRMMFMPPRPENMAARIADELQTRLTLTPPQAQKIRKIINDGMVQFQTIVGNEISTAFSNCNARIVLELTPKQQSEFWEIQKEHEKFLNNPFKGPPPPTNAP